MENRKRVVVCGSSLYMAGIAASLEVETGLSVVCLSLESPSGREKLLEMSPEVITFDMSDACPCLDVTLMRELPGLMLIGVDPFINQLLVLSCQSTQALSVADLVNVIRKKGATTPTDK